MSHFKQGNREGYDKPLIVKFFQNKDIMGYFCFPFISYCFILSWGGGGGSGLQSVLGLKSLYFVCFC